MRDQQGFYAPCATNEHRENCKREDHEAVVCFFLEIFDLSNTTVEQGTLHWEEECFSELKSEIRAKWGNQIPDRSFSKMFKRGQALLESISQRGERLREAGLILKAPEYDDHDETPYPTEDDKRDMANGTYDSKALLCFFMELFNAQNEDILPRTGRRKSTKI